MRFAVTTLLFFFVAVSSYADRKFAAETRWLSVSETGEVVSTGTAVPSDSLTVTEYGNWLYLWCFDLRVDHVDNQGSVEVQLNGTAKQRVEFEPVSVSGDDDWFTAYGFFMEPNFDDVDDKMRLVVDNAASDSTIARNRQLLAINLDDFGVRGVDWFYSQQLTTNNNLGTDWDEETWFSFTPSADEDYLVMQAGQFGSTGANDYMEHRVEVINTDKPDTNKFITQRVSVETITDDLWVNNIWTWALQADSLYRIESIWKEGMALDKILMIKDYLFACRVDMFQEFNLDTATRTTRFTGSNFVAVTGVTDTVLIDHDGSGAVLVLSNLAHETSISTSTTIDLQVRHHADGTVFDTVGFAQADFTLGDNDDTLSYGSFFLMDDDSKAEYETSMWGKNCTNCRYKAPGTFFAHLLNRFVMESDTVTRYMSTRSATNMLSSWMNEGAATTNYGSADSLRMGLSSGNEMNVWIRDTDIGNDGDSVSAQDDMIACTLWVTVREVPGSSDSVTIDVYAQNDGEGVTESEVTWNNQKTGTAWATGGGDGNLIHDNQIVVHGAGTDLMVWRIGTSFFDTVDIANDNRPVPIPIGEAGSDSMISVATAGLILKTDASRTTATGSVTFESEEATIDLRPFFTVAHADNGFYEVSPPVDPTNVVAAGNDDGSYGTASSATAAGGGAAIFDGYGYENASNTDNAYFTSPVAFIGPTSSSLDNTYFIGFHPDSIQAWFAGEGTLDSVRMAFASYANSLSAVNLAKGLAARVSRSVRAADVNTQPNGNNEGPGWDHYTNTTNWTTAGAKSTSTDITSPYFTSDACRSSATEGYAGGSSTWTDTLDANVFTSKDVEYWFLKLPVPYFDSINDGTFADMGGGFPYPLVIWNDGSVRDSDNSWRIPFSQFNRASDLSNPTIYWFFTPDAGGTIIRRSRILRMGL